MSNQNYNVTSRYDVIVIGAGSGGLTAAVGLSRLGKKVLLIEKETMGGECTNSGCIPSKTLLYHAKEYYKARKIVSDLTTLEKYRSTILEDVRKKIEEIYKEEEPDIFRKKGIDVLIGEAVLVRKFLVKVEDRFFKFGKLVIATGSSPKIIDIPGLDQARLLTNQNIFQLTHIPKSLVILGSGPIGLELGQAFAMLGTRVSIVTNEEKLISKGEIEISEVIENACEDLGITVYRQSKIQKVKGSLVTVSSVHNSENIHLEFDYILQAIGRNPNVPRGLDGACVAYDENGIKINRYFQTSQKNIFAIGDVALRDKFTHTADNAARDVVVRIATHGLLSWKNKKSTPKVIYTLPEVAFVGLSRDEVIKKYKGNFTTIHVPYAAGDRAKTDNKKEGIMIVYATKYTGRILGVSIIGESAGELLHIFSVAIDNRISIWKLHKTMYAYPTYSQLVKKVGDIYLSMVAERVREQFKFLFANK